MDRSIVSSTEDVSKTLKKGKEFFGTSGGTAGSGDISSPRRREKIDPDGILTNRLNLAASRIMTLYATIRANDVSVEVCHSLLETCRVDSEFLPRSPSEEVLRILQVAKQASLECAQALGGKRMAGPVPSPLAFDGGGRSNVGGVGGGGAAAVVGGGAKGLHLDVARMFKEKVRVYPHPRELMVGFVQVDKTNYPGGGLGTKHNGMTTTTAVITILFKIAFKAWSEHARLYGVFTSYSYRQVQVDVEFLKCMLPHYIGNHTSSSGSIESLTTLLDELLINVGERCVDMECVGITEYYDEVNSQVITPLNVAMGYLVEEDNGGGESSVLDQFLIREEEEVVGMEEGEEGGEGDVEVY